MKPKFEKERYTKELEMVNEQTNEFAITLGGQIAYARKYRGMTQGDLAELVGITRTTIAKIENGGQGTTVRSLNKICRALACQVALLPKYDHVLKRKKEDVLKPRPNEFEFELPVPDGGANDEKQNDSSST